MDLEILGHRCLSTPSKPLPKLMKYKVCGFIYSLSVYCVTQSCCVCNYYIRYYPPSVASTLHVLLHHYKHLILLDYHTTLPTSSECLLQCPASFSAVTLLTHINHSCPSLVYNFLNHGSAYGICSYRVFTELYIISRVHLST